MANRVAIKISGEQDVSRAAESAQRSINALESSARSAVGSIASIATGFISAQAAIGAFHQVNLGGGNQMGTVAVVKGDGSVEELASRVRTLEAEFHDARLAADDAELSVRNLPPFGGEGDIAHIRRRTTAARRDELNAELEAARARWLELARPGLIAQRDESLKDARMAAKDREAAVGALFDAVDGLLRANAAWSGAELAVRHALERTATACEVSALSENSPARVQLMLELQPYHNPYHNQTRKSSGQNRGPSLTGSNNILRSRRDDGRKRRALCLPREPMEGPTIRWSLA